MVFKNFLIVFLFFTTFNASASINEGIAAVVNDEIIFLSDLRAHIKNSGIKSNNKEVQRKYLKELTDLKLLELQAKRMGIVLTEEQLDNIEKNFIEKNTKEKVESELKRTGINLYRIRFGWKNQYYQESIASFILKSKIVISNEEIKEFYLKNYGEIKKEKLAHLYMIALEDSNNLSDKITKFKQDLNENGNFKLTVEEYISNKSFLPESKDLGYISVMEINKKISNSVSESNINQLIGPFKEENKIKYFYIKDKTVGDSQYLNMKDEIRNSIAGQKEFNVLDGWFKDLRENAYISIRI